jgi:hypothetical protein
MSFGNMLLKWGENGLRVVTTGLLIQSLNEVIDLHDKRLWYIESHVPEIIFIVLYGVSIMSLALVGSGGIWMWAGRASKSHIDGEGGDPYHFGHSSSR